MTLYVKEYLILTASQIAVNKENIVWFKKKSKKMYIIVSGETILWKY